MNDVFEYLKSLRRPKILIRAANFGLASYDRRRDLKKLFNTNSLPESSQAVHELILEEERLNIIRKSGDVSYSVSKHIEILVALMAEMSLLPKKVFKL